MSTFNAGAIEASLTLGRSNWVRDLKKTQREIKDLENKSITIGVDLDTDNARVAMDNLELMLDDLNNSEYVPTIDILTREAEDKLRLLEERLDRLDDRTVTVMADADIDNAIVQLDNLEGMMDTLENDPINITAETDFESAYFALDALDENIDLLDGRTINIDTDVDAATSSARLALLDMQMDLVDGRTLHVDVDVDEAALVALTGPAGSSGGGGHLGLLKILMYAIIALSPILAVSMGAATASIVAFVAAAAGAAGAAGVLAVGIAGLVGRFKEAKQEGEELTAPMQALDDALDGLSASWDTFLNMIEDTGFDLMANGVNLLSQIIPSLVPLFNATAEAMGGVLEGIRDFVQSAEYDEMIEFFSGFGVDMLVSFLRIGGNLVRFFGRLFQAIEPFARQMMQGLEDVTAGWMEWADDLENNTAFQDFMENAAKYGPMVLDMLGSLIAAFMNIGRALEPLAGPMLDGLIFFFDLIANADPTTLTVIITLLAGLWLGLSVLAPAISAVVGGLTALGAVLGIGLAPVILIVAALAALAGVIWYLWETNETFRSAVVNTWNAIVDAVEPAVTAISNLIRNNWGPISKWAGDIWRDVQGIVTDAMVIVQQVVRGGTALVKAIWNTFGDNIVFQIKTVAQVVGGVVRGMFNIVRGIFQVFKGILTGDWDAVWSGIKNITRGAVGALGSILRGLIQTAFNISSGIMNAFNGMVGYFRGLPGRVSGAVSGLFNGIRDNFRGVINDIIGMWNSLSFSVDIPDKIPGLPSSFTVSTPDVGYLAEGGYITDPGLFVVGEGKDNEIVAPEPVLERIVRENGGANIDYGRMAAAVANALATTLSKMGSVTREDIERLIEAAGMNLTVDARTEGDTAGQLASAIGFELRRLGFGGKDNV